MKALAYLMVPSMGLPTIFSSHLTGLVAAAGRRQMNVQAALPILHLIQMSVQNTS